MTNSLLFPFAPISNDLYKLGLLYGHKLFISRDLVNQCHTDARKVKKITFFISTELSVLYLQKPVF